MTAAALRSTLGDGNSRLVVSAYDALTARVAEAAGFEILHVTGFGSAAAITGGPDIGLVTMTEMVETTRRICDAVERPVIADADCGYGNPLNVMRTVRALEAAGAAGLHLEDQVTPKRCGHMAGKAVIPTAEMVAKVAAAVDARDDPDFVIIARTDARAPEGLDAALERAHAYSAAGADVLFVEAPESRDEIRRIAGELSGPQLFNWAYEGRTPHVSRRWLEELGFAWILFADVALAVHRAAAGFYERLAEIDSPDELRDLLTGFDAFNEFVGLGEWRRSERRYAAPTDE
ncbi:MAG: isocitrate lyase/phosphoenolpyruvate mutase family protein [bacterium]|nr:isocitrate lyase/phosphoenolpyruvate mutase family protein [bacterium]